MRWWTSALVAGLSVAPSACERELAPEIIALNRAPDSASMAEEEAAIHALADRYEAAFASGEPVRVLYHYTDGAAYIDHDGRVGSAEEELRSLFSDLPAGAKVRLTSQYTVVGSSGDVAYDVGRYTLETAASRDEPESYRYVAGLKKIDGEWKIDLMMISAPIDDSS